MNEKSKRIKELRDEIKKLECEIRELEIQNYNFYIGFYKEGDGDYVEQYYTQLGFMSEEEAKKMIEAICDDDAYDIGCFEVTEDIYLKYGHWGALRKLKIAINTYNPAIRKLDGVYQFKDEVIKAERDLAEVLGVELSYMRPVIE